MGSSPLNWQQILGLAGQGATTAANTINGQQSGLSATQGQPTGLTTGFPTNGRVDPNAAPAQIGPDVANAMRGIQRLRDMHGPNSGTAANANASMQGAQQAVGQQPVNPSNVLPPPSEATPPPTMNAPMPGLDSTSLGTPGQPLARGGMVERRAFGSGPVGGAPMTGNVGNASQSTSVNPTPPPGPGPQGPMAPPSSLQGSFVAPRPGYASSNDPVANALGMGGQQLTPVQSPMAQANAMANLNTNSPAPPQQQMSPPNRPMGGGGGWGGRPMGGPPGGGMPQRQFGGGRACGGMVEDDHAGGGSIKGLHPVAKIKIQSIHPIRMTNPMGSSAGFAEGGSTMEEAGRTDHFDPGTTEFETHAHGGGIDGMAGAAHHLRAIHHMLPKSAQPHNAKTHKAVFDELHNSVFGGGPSEEAAPDPMAAAAAGPGAGAPPPDAGPPPSAGPSAAPPMKHGGEVKKKKHKAGGGAISGKDGEEKDSKAPPVSKGEKIGAAKEGYARGGYVDPGTTEFSCGTGAKKEARGMGEAKRGGGFTYKRGGSVKK